MNDGKFLKIYSPELGQKYAPFSIYLPAGKGLYAEYRFYYMKKGINTELLFSGGPNDPSNCEFYRIREAYMGKLESGVFMQHFRVLQGGEVGFAFCEKGAGDFCGGFFSFFIFAAGRSIVVKGVALRHFARVKVEDEILAVMLFLLRLRGSLLLRCGTILILFQ